ncbi:MAG: hypothetical protein LT070_05045 [Solirubrobacteraceae bacterium]|nr:hypothetical protein [Solirubrobacteraceae bacterium]
MERGPEAIIAVTRADHEEPLAEVDLVVTSLDDVDVDTLRSGRIRGR